MNPVVLRAIRHLKEVALGPLRRGDGFLSLLFPKLAAKGQLDFLVVGFAGHHLPLRLPDQLIMVLLKLLPLVNRLHNLSDLINNIPT